MTQYDCPNCDSTEFYEVVEQDYTVNTTENTHEPAGMVELLHVKCRACGTVVFDDDYSSSTIR